MTLGDIILIGIASVIVITVVFTIILSIKYSKSLVEVCKEIFQSLKKVLKL